MVKLFWDIKYSLHWLAWLVMCIATLTAATLFSVVAWIVCHALSWVMCSLWNANVAFVRAADWIVCVASPHYEGPTPEFHPEGVDTAERPAGGIR